MSLDAVDDSDRRGGLARVLWIIGIGFFVQSLSSGIARLPLRLLLKNHLHLPPMAVAAFIAVAGVAWYLKPIAGAFADNVTIRGSRYRNYLLISAIGAALAWCLMGIIPPTYALLLGVFVAVNTFLMFISTVLGGFMVIEGREFKATGRLSSFRKSAMTASGLIAGPIGGFLAGRAFGWTACVNAALLLCFFVYLFAAMREPRLTPTAVGAPSPMQKLLTDLKPLLGAKTFWAAVGMTFLLESMPGFGTPLLYYQTDVLHLSPQFIGNLALYGGITGMFGSAVYLILCRRFSLRTMLAISIVVGTLGTTLYEFYHFRNAVIPIEATHRLFGALASIALMDLAARAAPVRSASMCYSVLMAVDNLASSLSDVGGSWLHDKFHMSIFTLIWISAGTTLLTIIAVPFLPKELVDAADGHAAAST